MLLTSERERIQALARELNTTIPGDSSLAAWALPLLEMMLLRIKQLEEKINAS